MEYEVEFWVGSTEYDYTIDGATGAVLQSEQKSRTASGGSAAAGSASGGGSSADIGSEGALNIALDHAGVARDQVYDLEVKQEYDDGRLEYEVEFKAGGWEYEYTILAADGTILDYERDD